jgi:hypothetical protein
MQKEGLVIEKSSQEQLDQKISDLRESCLI